MIDNNKLNKYNTLAKGLAKGLGGCLAIIIMNLIVAWVLMSLWNWILVDLVKLPEITFWQSLGVMILFRLFAGYFKK